jgi:hypothetical protein
MKTIEPKYTSCHSSIRLIEENIKNCQSVCPVALEHVFEQLMYVNSLMGKADRNDGWNSWVVSHRTHIAIGFKTVFMKTIFF